MTNYTVFKSVKFGQGEVVTGWDFRSNQNYPEPWRQYCYYLQGSSDDFNASMKYNVGLNGVIVQLGRYFPVDIQQAFSNCVWWRAS